MTRTGRKAFVGCFAAGAVFLLGASPAWADTRTITDRNDSAVALDISRATHGHAGAAFVTHSVTTFQPFTSPFLQGQNSFTFQFDTNHTPRSFERFVFVVWANGRLRAFVGNRTRVIGTAAVSRPNARTVRVKVRRSLLHPNIYRWIAVAFGASGFDIAPNGAPVTHDMIGPKITHLNFPNPSSDVSTNLTFPVSFQLTDPSKIASWVLEKRPAGSSVWETVAQGAFQGNKEALITGEEGSHYVFRVRATDGAGNVSSVERPVSVPFDDNNPVFASAYAGTFDSKASGSECFQSWVHVLDTNGTFTYTFTGTSVTVLGYSLPFQPGTATVSIDGEPPVLVDPTLLPAGCSRKVFERSGLAPGSHTIVIARQTGQVTLDGFVFR
jgi:hypothetical protein